MNDGQLAVGTRHTSRIDSTALRHLSRTLSRSGSEAFCTSSMIAYAVEQSAIQFLHEMEAPTLTTAKDTSVRHIIADTIEHMIVVEIEIIKLDADEISFNATCFDSGGQIGGGTHTRLIDKLFTPE